ncbi:MAG: DUF2974 domain-containing protein [Clostridiales bacterium]|nr:DUF2974 domain-containing protein [Clostridiales bacterium]
MKNIIDYVETEFRSFAEKPFCAVDSLVLSQFSYIRFDGVVPGMSEHAAPRRIADCFMSEHFETMFYEVRDPDSNRRLLAALASSPRFRNIEMTFYVSEFDPVNGKQFSAVTFILPDKNAYIAFRGTDDTIVGWKEDFRMAFVFPVPSQVRAGQYLSEVSSRLSGKFMIGGHSKGGNLAVYSAFTAPESIQSRIIRIYDHDGPGFKEGTLNCEGYKRIESKIAKTIPQSSVIGMLLEGHEKYTVVESSRIGVMQHDPFSWKIADGDFITAEEVSDGAKYVNRTIRDWINSLSDEQREKFTDILFGVLDAGEAETFAEITLKWKRNFTAIFSAIKDIDPEMKQFIKELMREFGILMIHNLRPGKKMLSGVSQMT